MSEIGNTSITQTSPTENPSPLGNSILNPTDQDIEKQVVHTKKTMNNQKTNVDTNLVKINNCLDKREHQNENKAPKLKIAVTNTDQTKTNSSIINVRNDLSKAQSPISEKNSLDFLMSTKKSSPSPNKPRPIMGRSALLKKANIETNDSRIVHELITDKYSDVLNHYYKRMYERKMSRQESSEEDYSDTVFSSPPNCSPLSLSSINSSNSTCPDEKNGFSFPNSQVSSDKNVYGFLVSTDDANIETTVENFDVSSVDSASTCNEKDSGISDYDANKFLDNALGGMNSASSNDVHEENQENRRNHDDQKTENSDLCTLFSKTTSLYTSMKRKVKRSSSKTMAPTNPEDPCNNNRLSVTSNNSRVENLMRELAIQNEIMFQVSKALNYCKMTKEFESSVELLEAEKILLVAWCTKEALTKEIQYMEDDTYESKDDHRSYGQVEISNLKFPGKDINKTDINTHRDFTENFLVILTSASTVLASDVVVADENGHVTIDKTFRFTKLPTDFDISVCIYSMRVGNKPQQQEQKSSCPSPKKIFLYLQKDSKKYKVLNNILHIKPSSFILCGKCEIRSPELSKIKQQSNDPANLTLKLHNTPLSSSLSETFSMNIKSEVKLTNRISGFLTLGVDNEHGCTIWNRRWCVLEGSNLKYWSYPSEEVVSPLGSLDLSYCVEQKICVADRDMYVRPRTLMLSIRHNQTIKKYALSADDVLDMKQWETELNYVIYALRVWNCMNE